MDINACFCLNISAWALHALQLAEREALIGINLAVPVCVRACMCVHACVCACMCVPVCVCVCMSVSGHGLHLHLYHITTYTFMLCAAPYFCFSLAHREVIAE